MIEITQDELLSRYAAGERNFSAVNIKRDPCIVQGIKTLYFRDVDLQGINLSGVDLRCSYFTRCNLSGAILSGAILNASSFYEANLERATAVGIMLTNCTIKLSNFRYANLTGACLYRSSCVCVDFTRANMSNSNLTQCRVDGSDFRDVGLDMAILIDVDFSKADGSASWAAEDAFVCNVTWSRYHEPGPKYIH